MQRICIVFMVVMMVVSPPVLAGSLSVLKGEHFIVYYPQKHTSFAKDVLNNAERYYHDIARELGYQRYSQFWLWEKRVKIFIYPDHATYLSRTGMQSWSHGMADYAAKKIVSYVRGEGFLTSILPHEIGHLLFRDFVGFKGEVPLWLDEGVAQWAEKEKRELAKALMKDAFINRKFLSLPDMMRIDLSRLKSEDEVHVKYATHHDEPIVLVMDGKSLVNLYYLQAVSVVGFLIEKHGTKNFTAFCRELRDGKTIEEALASVYAHSMRTIAELDTAWRNYLEGH